MKTSVLIFFIVLSGLGVKAQYPNAYSPENHATRELKPLKSMLNLTAQQTEKVMQIYMNHYNPEIGLKP